MEFLMEWASWLLVLGAMVMVGALVLLGVVLTLTIGSMIVGAFALPHEKVA